MSKLTYSTLQHCWRMLYTMNGNSKHLLRKIEKKPVSSEFWPKFSRYINCSLKRLNQHFLLKCISTHNVLHNYKVSRNSIERFQWCCADKLFWVVSFILVKFCSSKWTYLREKKMNQKFLWICTSTWYVLHNYKLSRTFVELYQRSCADKLFQ